MTKEMLESYVSKKAEIQELWYKLKHIREDDSIVGNDIILDYTKGYPRPQAVIGLDWKKVYRMEGKYKRRLEELEKECLEIEEYIEAIADSMTRRIFRMRYIDGMSQSKVAKKVHASQSYVSKKISKNLKWNKNNKNTCYNNT